MLSAALIGKPSAVGLSARALLQVNINKILNAGAWSLGAEESTMLA